MHGRDHYDVDRIFVGLSWATLPTTVRSCARTMADNGETKGLKTPPPRWVSAQLLYVWVSAWQWLRGCSPNLCRPFQWVCIKDWMNTKNSFHIISLERKMIWVLMWYRITSQQATPIAPPKATPTCCTSVYRHVCLDFWKVLPICRNSGHVSATLMDKLQHMLLWRSVGELAVQYYGVEKRKSFAFVFIFGDNFRRFLETIVQTIILQPRNLLRAMILESRKKSENSCSCKSATQLVRFVGTNMWVWLWVGQWAWPGGMWWDITPYTHSIFLSWDITCNPCQY